MAVDETTRKRWEREDKMKEPSKEDLLNCFDGMCLFLAIHGWAERDERAVAIRKLIEKKTKVTRELVEKWADMIDTDPHRCTEASLMGILVEVGVEVEEK